MRWLIALLPSVALAQPYIEIGIGYGLGGCVYNQPQNRLERRQSEITFHPGCSRSPLGLFAVGYQFNDQWRIQWDHWSSLPDTKDRGMEIISIRYRYTFR